MNNKSRLELAVAVLAATALFFLTPVYEASALYPEVHSLMSYEASFIAGVPSEVRVYAGEPAHCLHASRPTICSGAYDEDADRDPRLTPGIGTLWGLLNWGTHFWDPAGGPHGGRLEKVGDLPVNLEGENAYERAVELYGLALAEYTEDPEASYHTLGRIVHLLTDMATPAHVHLDPHISPDIEGDDSLEEYTAFLYVPPVIGGGRTAFETDFPITNLSPVDYGSLSDGGYPDSPALYRIFSSLALLSSLYDSDDAPGQLDRGSRRGRSIHLSHTGAFSASVFGPGFEVPLTPQYYRTSVSRGLFILPESLFDNTAGTDPSVGVRLDFAAGSESHSINEFVRTDIGDADVREIALQLFPTALSHVAGLYELFWQETHPSLRKGDLPLLTMEGGSRSIVVSRPAHLAVRLDLDPQGWADAEVEVFAWADSAEEVFTRAYFDGLSWKAFSNLKEMVPAGSVRLISSAAASWVILTETSYLPPVGLTLNICIDREMDGRYSPESSVCQSITVKVE